MMNAPVTFWEKNAYGSKLVFDYMLEALEGYDGNNALEHLSQLSKHGLVHSPFPDPHSFVLGMCSTHEVDVVRAVLSPADKKIIKGHLLDIVDDGSCPKLQIRSLDGSIVLHPIEPGSFIVDCTDHVRPIEWGPIISDDGLVVSPQNAAGFSGPSANLVVHLFYTNRDALRRVWKELPRMRIDMEKDKARFGLDLLMLVLCNSAVLRSKLPKNAQKYAPTRNDLPLHRAVVMALRTLHRFRLQIKRSSHIITGRFTDECRPEAMASSLLRHGRVGEQTARIPSKL